LRPIGRPCDDVGDCRAVAAPLDLDAARACALFDELLRELAALTNRR
jgi:hypothetical protein